MEYYIKDPYTIPDNPQYEPYYTFYMDGIHSFNPISQIKFDLFDENFWCSTIYGQITGYSMDSLDRVMSRPLTQNNQMINDFEIAQDVILAISDDTVHCIKRNGLLKFVEKNEQEFFSLKQLSLHPVEQDLLYIARSAQNDSNNSSILVTNVRHDCRVVNTISLNSEQCIVKLMPVYDRMLCVGLSGGDICFLDWRCANKDSVVQKYNNNNLHSITTPLSMHNGGLLDIAIKSEQNLLVTCGAAARAQGGWIENFIKVYDIRFKRVTSHLPISLKPQFVRFLPIAKDRLISFAANGCYSLVEFGTTVPIHPILPGAFPMLNHPQTLTSLALCPTGQCIAMGTLNGQIILMSVLSMLSSDMDQVIPNNDISVLNSMQNLVLDGGDQETDAQGYLLLNQNMNSSEGMCPMNYYLTEESDEIIATSKSIASKVSDCEKEIMTSNQQHITEYLGDQLVDTDYQGNALSSLDLICVNQPVQPRINFLNKNGDEYWSRIKKSIDEMPKESIIVPNHETLYKAQNAISVDADLSPCGTSASFFFTLIPFALEKLGDSLISDWPDELKSDVMYRSQNPVEEEVLNSGKNVCGNFVANPPVNNSAYNNVWFPYAGKKLNRTNLINVPQFRFRDESLSEMSP